MTISDITIESNNGSFTAYLATPENKGAPGIVLIQEIFGVNHHIRSVADRLAAAGFMVIAPDIFHAQQPGIQLGYDQQGMNRGMQLLQQLNPQTTLDDIDACIRYLKQQPGCSKVGITGFCMGGMLSYLAAANLQVDAAACYYGGGTVNLLDQAGNIGCPIIFHFGERDSFIPLDQVEQIRQATAGLKSCEIYLYDADHGFNCDERESYHEPSATAAWQRTIQLFTEQLVG